MTHGIVEILRDNASIKSIVGRNTADTTWKVYPIIIPQDEKPPYVCVKTSTGAPFGQCKGEPSDQDQNLVQVDCFAGSYEDAYILWRSIRQVLDGTTNETSDGGEISSSINSWRDYSISEMELISKRNIWGITTTYNAEVKLGTIT